MTLHDDRTFVRHFSWVILALVGITIFFIFIAFLIVGVTGVEGHSGYSYVEYMNKHPVEAAKTRAYSQAAPTHTGAVAGVAAAGEAVAAASAASGGKAAVAINGEAIWKAHCSVCHATGVAGAPKIGDKAAWAPLLKEADLATLYERAINGYSGSLGFMPPRGGASNLSDAQVKAAVKYMVDKSK